MNLTGGKRQVSLLAEIIKQARVTPGALLKLIVELDVQPRWEDIPLPDGRALRFPSLVESSLDGLSASNLGAIAACPI